jgi:vancomycin resistance protein YoaR
LYQDLKDLYAKVIPPLAGFDEKMDNMAAGYEQSKEMLRRYDEVLTEKANKTAIKELQEHMKIFVKQEKLVKVQGEIDSQFEEVKKQQENLKNTLHYLSESINTEI